MADNCSPLLPYLSSMVARHAPFDKQLRPLSGAAPLCRAEAPKSFELTAFHVAVHWAPTEQSASSRNIAVGVSAPINSFGR
jgi:hypothetical protein